MKQQMIQTEEDVKLAGLLSKVEYARSEKLAQILAIQTEALAAIHEFMHKKRITQIMPVIIAPMTDPLFHSVEEADISYGGQKLMLTKSMILHKFMTLMSDHIDSIYAMSPCVRLEHAENKTSGRHLIEFTQVDIELKDADKRAFMDLIEELVTYVLGRVKERCADELKALGRELHVPEGQFKVFIAKDLEEQYGPDYEKIISKQLKEPFWITELVREFYDREDANYDLVWPEGFGEALSGGQRYYEHEEIIRIMDSRGQDKKHFEAYLELAKRGLLKPTSGGGLGIERLVRFIAGLEHIREVGPFTKVPGEEVLL